MRTFFIFLLVTVFFLFWLGNSLRDLDCKYEEIDELVSYALQPWPIVSESDVNTVSCDYRIRFQYLNNEWYVIEDPKQLLFSRSASFKLFFMTLQQFYREEIPNGLDFVIDVSDGNYNSGPVLSYCREYNKTAILIPDYAFFSWPESGQNSSYQSLYYSLKQIAALGDTYKDIDAESNKLFFVGNLFKSRRQLLKGYSDSEVLIRAHKFTGASKDRDVPEHHATYTSIFDMCKHPYLLHLPGGISYSSRLRYLLSCNSTVVWLDHWIDDSLKTTATPRYVEWFYKALKPDYHFIAAKNGEELNNHVKRFSHCRMKGNNQHTCHHKRIAHQGALLMQELLSVECVRLYWLRLFQEYKRRMTFSVIQPHQDAKLLIHSVLLDIRNADIGRSQELQKWKKRQWWWF
jgi:hypothetical protein